MKLIQKTFKNAAGESVAFVGNTLPARKSIKYLTKLTKILSSIAGELDISSSKKAPETGLANTLDTIGNIDMSKLVKSIGENIDNDELYDIVLKLFDGCELNKKLLQEDTFDMVFSGDLGLMLEILAFILVSNYGNLFKKKLFSNIKEIFMTVM